MNHSLYSIDRSTHAKIVALALIAATAIFGTSLAVRYSGINGEEQAPAFSLIKAAKPALVVSRLEITVR